MSPWRLFSVRVLPVRARSETGKATGTDCARIGTAAGRSFVQMIGKGVNCAQFNFSVVQCFQHARDGYISFEDNQPRRSEVVGGSCRDNRADFRSHGRTDNVVVRSLSGS